MKKKRKIDKKGGASKADRIRVKAQTFIEIGGGGKSM